MNKAEIFIKCYVSSGRAENPTPSSAEGECCGSGGGGGSGLELLKVAGGFLLWQPVSAGMFQGSICSSSEVLVKLDSCTSNVGKLFYRGLLGSC